VYGFQFINCWTSGATQKPSGGSGLILAPTNGAVVNDCQFSNHILTQIQINGVQITPAANSSVSGMLFGKLQNDDCQDPSHGGFYLDASASGTINGISITGGYAGNAPNAINFEEVAVFIDPAHATNVTNVLVLGLDTSTIDGSPTISNPAVSSSVWFHRCLGYNPIGNLIAPSGSPGTGAVTNLTGVDQNVWIYTNDESTVTAIHVGGVLTGLSIPALSFLQVPVPAGQTIAVNPEGSGVGWYWIGN
jgi:hypothetical protein